METARSTKKAKTPQPIQSKKPSKEKDKSGKENGTRVHSTRASVSRQSSAAPDPPPTAPSFDDEPESPEGHESHEVNGGFDEFGTPIPIKRKREERGEGIALRRNAAAKAQSGQGSVRQTSTSGSVRVQRDGEGDVIMGS